MHVYPHQYQELQLHHLWRCTLERTLCETKDGRHSLLVVVVEETLYFSYSLVDVVVDLVYVELLGVVAEFAIQLQEAAVAHEDRDVHAAVVEYLLP